MFNTIGTTVYLLLRFERPFSTFLGKGNAQPIKQHLFTRHEKTQLPKDSTSGQENPAKSAKTW